MGIRETMNRNPQIATGLVVVAVLAAVWMAWSSAFGGKKFYSTTTAYFTADDGATYFKDSKDTLVPYTKDGKEVVHAGVMYCPDKGKFVAFLHRYTPEAKEALLDAQAAKKEGRKPKNPGMVAMASQLGSEFKKPGAGNPWVRGASGGVVTGEPVLCADQKTPAELSVP